MRKATDGIVPECLKGDIKDQGDVKAVVNAANARLDVGGGIAGAIHRAAGPGLVEKCRPLSPIEPGEAVITGGHRLPSAHAIHCLGSVNGVDHPGDELLAAWYDRRSLEIHERALRDLPGDRTTECA